MQQILQQVIAAHSPLTHSGDTQEKQSKATNFSRQKDQNIY